MLIRVHTLRLIYQNCLRGRFKHYLKEGGGVTKQASSFVYIIPSQACKLRRECADEITEELYRNFAEIAPRALNILTDLAENAERESVRLGATRDLLDRAGFRHVDRLEIVKEKTVKELNAQLVSLVGENGAEMLISAFKSRRSISGHELA